MNLSALIKRPHTNSLVSTAILLAAVAFGRGILVRLARGDDDILREEQWRRISRIQNGAIILLLIGLVFVWLPELNAFALSITAFAVVLPMRMKTGFDTG